MCVHVPAGVCACGEQRSALAGGLLELTIPSAFAFLKQGFTM